MDAAIWSLNWVFLNVEKMSVGIGGFLNDCVFTFSVHDASANNVENLNRLRISGSQNYQVSDLCVVVLANNRLSTLRIIEGCFHMLVGESVWFVERILLPQQLSHSVAVSFDQFIGN